MAQRAYGGYFQQEPTVQMTIQGSGELADGQQERYRDFQNPRQIARQDSADSKEAKSVGGSRGEYSRDFTTGYC